MRTLCVCGNRFEQCVGFFLQVAHNVWSLLSGSKFAITEAEVDREDDATALKQDRSAFST